MRTLVAYTLSHESGHVYDFSNLERWLEERNFDFIRHDWTNEAVAAFFDWLTIMGGSESLLNGNRDKAEPVGDGFSTGWSCAYPSRASLRGFYTRSLYAYATTCQWTSWLSQQAADRGVSIGQVFSRLRDIPKRRTMADMYNAVIGTSRSPSEIVGEWLLSWYADDFVPGTAPPLQDRAFNLRKAVPGYEWPSVTWTDQSTSVRTQIGEPDVYMVEIRASGSTIVDFRLASGENLPGDRLGVAILRAK